MSCRYLIQSDLHLGHSAVFNFEPLRTSFEDIIKDVKNNTYAKDIIINLGDIGFQNADYWMKEYRQACKGKIILVKGNHDRNRSYTHFYKHGFDFVCERFSLNIYGYHILFSHQPVEVKDGAIGVFGHCVDSETEILTLDGWKSYNELKVNDKIYSMNPDTNNLECDYIDDIIINENYNGDVYHFQGKGVDMRITDKHRVCFYSGQNFNKYTVETANTAFKRSLLKLRLSGEYDSPGLQLSDKLLELYIALVADGNITYTNLCRFILKKPRKIEKIEDMLTSLNIVYSKNTHKSEMVAINFKLPKELEGYKIKGLDEKILQCNKRQVEIIRNTYRWTDGNRNLIFTSKTEEVNILQHLFVINGYTCKVHSRKGHGFSKGISYELSVSDNTTRTNYKVKDRVKKENVKNELFWCVKTRNNGNFLSRRNGAVVLTGNCHRFNHTIEEFNELYPFLGTEYKVFDGFVLFRNYILITTDNNCKLQNLKLIIDKYRNTWYTIDNIINKGEE
jgi:calcineurin-like phosphoesterase family protein